MATRYEIALAFLNDPSRVRLYTNAERASTPCPNWNCGAKPGEKCNTRDGKPHPERVNLETPRSEDETRAILEKLARRYSTTHNPMESYGPRSYPRAPKSSVA
jgi:hypothetical protein